MVTPLMLLSLMRVPKRGNMKIYSVYVLKVYFDGNARSDEIEWSRNVRAGSRTAALEKCLPEIIKLEPRLRSVVKQYSVHVGEKHNPTAYANRLVPISRKRERFWDDKDRVACSN